MGLALKQELTANGSRRRCREYQVQFSRNVYNEELSKRYGGEEAEERAHKGDGEDAAEIVFGVLGQQAKAVHCR